MKNYPKLLILILLLLFGIMQIACATVDRSQAWANAEATRRAWAAEHYVTQGD